MQCYSFMCGSLSHNKEIQSGLIGLPLFTELYVPARVTVEGTTYRSGIMLFMSYDTDGDPQFGLLKTILVLKQMGRSRIKLVVQKWETLGFEKHLFAYSVIPTKDLLATDVEELLDHHPLHAVKSYREHDDTSYISVRY